MSFLRSLSNKQILAKITELVDRERALTRDVLLHLNEIERRRLHLKLGYASMFEYCTTGLGYSSSAAGRRIRTARCLARFSEILKLLKGNRVNLSTVSQVSKVLTLENKEWLLARICGKSQREVDAVIAELDPRPIPHDRVRPIVAVVEPLPLAASSAVTTTQSVLSIAAPVVDPSAPTANAHTDNDLHPDHCRSGSDSRPSSASTTRRVQISFAAGEAFAAKLDKVRSLAWHRLPANASLEQVFRLALDFFIQHEDPVARKQKRAEKATAKKVVNAPTTQSKPGTRHIAATVKEDVFARDQGCCSYVGDSGKRCGSTQALQIDHIEPFAHGGDGSMENLRLLCAYHNRLEAERILGPARRWEDDP